MDGKWGSRLLGGGREKSSRRKRGRGKEMRGLRITYERTRRSENAYSSQRTRGREGHFPRNLV